MYLGCHTPTDGVIHQIGQVIKEERQCSEGLINHGQNVTKAREDLETVVAADQTVVARVGLEVKLIHDLSWMERKGDCRE